MKIVQITNLYPPFVRGGTEVYTEDLVNILASDSANAVYVITNVKGEKFRNKNFINLGIKNSDVLTELLLPNPLIYRKIKETLNEIKPDIVHVHNIHVSLSTAAISAARDFPLALTVHDFYLFCPTLRFMFEDGRTCEMDRCTECLQRYYSAGVVRRWGLLGFFLFYLNQGLYALFFTISAKDR